ncbi:MAG: nucleotidyltransferase family protein [Rhodobacteraceae bacterium]|nr:nucleotidyltransferase family protein [Paracoccaceae bacterium]
MAILILAAGHSSRMGHEDKLMKDANGTPLLARVIIRAHSTHFPVFVTLPALDHPRAALLRGTDATPIAVPDRSQGMAASIRRGIDGLPDQTPGVMILPGDMPDLTTKDLTHLSRIFENNPGHIIRATTEDGRSGHPVIFPAKLFAQLRRISGDQGARAVVKAHMDRLRQVALPGNHAICDLDTPADWTAWNANWAAWNRVNGT